MIQKQSKLTEHAKKSVKAGQNKIVQSKLKSLDLVEKNIRHFGNYREFFRYILSNNFSDNELELADDLE